MSIGIGPGGPAAPYITRKRDGLLMTRADYSIRYLTWWEALRYRLTGRLPKDAK